MDVIAQTHRSDTDCIICQPAVIQVCQKETSRDKHRSLTAIDRMLLQAVSFPHKTTTSTQMIQLWARALQSSLCGIRISRQSTAHQLVCKASRTSQNDSGLMLDATRRCHWQPRHTLNSGDRSFSAQPLNAFGTVCGMFVLNLLTNLDKTNLSSQPSATHHP